MIEEWKNIQGSNDGEISSYGRIKRNGVLLIPQVDTEGYLRASVGGIGRERLHVLVAKHFLSNPNNLPIVDHIDKNRQNNNVTNLRWVSYVGNNLNTIHPKPRREHIIGHNLETNQIIEFESQADAERKLGISNKDINKNLKRQRQFTHGWVFYYKSDYQKLDNH